MNTWKQIKTATKTKKQPAKRNRLSENRSEIITKQSAFNTNAPTLCELFGWNHDRVYNLVRRKLVMGKHYMRKSHKELLFDVDAIISDFKEEPFMLIPYRSRQQKIFEKEIAKGISKLNGRAVRTILTKFQDSGFALRYSYTRGEKHELKDSVIEGWRKAADYYFGGFQSNSQSIKNAVNFKRLVNKLPEELKPFYKLKNKVQSTRLVQFEKSKLLSLRKNVLIGKSKIAKHLGCTTKTLQKYRKELKNMPIHIRNKSPYIYSGELDAHYRIRKSIHFAYIDELDKWVSSLDKHHYLVQRRKEKKFSSPPPTAGQALTLVGL
ncbi:MAG: hypothetical protein HZA15_11100 [Nitrospirae bacterium]|nr:hypothetical protein [Nitrospirota bacterium]